MSYLRAIYKDGSITQVVKIRFLWPGKKRKKCRKEEDESLRGAIQQQTDVTLWVSSGLFLSTGYEHCT